jgi:uncharacterized damage-inducible protein DinB
MPESDPLRILLAHDRWGTQQILDACAKLEAEQLHRRFDIGPGSLHDTLTHVVAAIRALTDTLSGQAPRPRLDQEGQRRTTDELRALLDESSQEFATESRRRPLDETVIRRTRDGRTLVMTRATVVVHVTTHGTHHRAQCLNMLRHLGVTPLPPTSVAEWTWVGDAQAR